MRSMPPTVLMYLAMMSSAVCADSGRAKSASPASLRRVFRMGSPRRDTVFDSGTPKIVVCGGAARGPSSPTACASPGFRHDRAIVRHQLSRSAASSGGGRSALDGKSEEHTSELQSRLHLVCRLLLEKKKKIYDTPATVSRLTAEL